MAEGLSNGTIGNLVILTTVRMLKYLEPLGFGPFTFLASDETLSAYETSAVEMFG